MPPLLQAVLWFGGTMTGFAGMAIAARSLHAEMSTFEILFFRSLIGVLVVLPFIIRANFVDIKVQKFHWHLGRAIVQFGAQICWMYGIVHLTLSDLTAIEFSVPIFTALLAVLFLGERMWRHKWVATILGFAGVLISEARRIRIQPRGTGNDFRFFPLCRLRSVGKIPDTHGVATGHYILDEPSAAPSRFAASYTYLRLGNTEPYRHPVDPSLGPIWFVGPLHYGARTCFSRHHYRFSSGFFASASDGCYRLSIIC